MSDQERLDKATKALWRLKEEAEKEAIAACDRGDFATSERLHLIASKLHEAYGLGRGLNMLIGGGVIQPLSGGKRQAG